MRDSKPPALGSHSPLLQVGKNSHDHWVVRDPKGRCGGLFAECADALKFARIATGNSPHAVVMVPGVLELEFGNSRAGDMRAIGMSGLARVA